MQRPERPGPSGDVRGRILALLREMGGVFDDMQDDLAATAGLSRSELAALLQLEESPEPVTMRHLSDGLSLTPGSITSLVDRLEERGHVRRGRDPQDRRRVLVTTTASADAVAMSFFGALAGRVVAVLDSYEPEELAVIEDFLRRVVPAMVGPVEEA